MAFKSFSTSMAEPTSNSTMKTSKSNDSVFHRTIIDSGNWSSEAKSLENEDYIKWKKVDLIDDLVMGA
jgi:hypothetical protein